MNGHCDVGWLSYWYALQKGALCIKNSKYMLAIREDIVFVRVVHESIDTSGVPKECLEAVNALEVNLDSKMCTSVLGLANSDFLRGVSCFVESCPPYADRVLLDDISLACSLNSDFAWYVRCCRAASFSTRQYLRIHCRMDESDS